MFDDCDFDIPDPFVRYQAHQAAKGNTTALNPDVWDSRDKTAVCGHAARTFDGAPLTCEKPLGHGGFHEQSARLRDRVERTNWGSDGLAIHATKDGR